MTARDFRNGLFAGVVVLLMCVGLALLAGCDDKGDSGFDASCKTRGGTPTTVHRGGSTVRICNPPAGSGWQ